MIQPPIFISCVAPEFRQTRGRVASILTRLGYTPVIQEIFGTESGDLRQVLRDKINACEGLIQIVGQGYGAEPPTVDARYGRVSYTQFEFLYARSQDKNIWIIFAGEACTRDTPVERLDLPNDPAHRDPASYQAERRALQLTYRDRLRAVGRIYYDATSDTALELIVERLENEFAKLGRLFAAWLKEVGQAGVAAWLKEVGQAGVIPSVVNDVFISCKNLSEHGVQTRDAEIAAEVYYFLTGKGLNVFLSTFTLEQLGASDYTSAIDSALESASVLLAIGTSADHLNSKWVKYEWDSFANDIRSGIKPNGRLFTYIDRDADNSFAQGFTPNSNVRALRRVFAAFTTLSLDRFPRRAAPRRMVRPMASSTEVAQSAPRLEVGVSSTDAKSYLPADVADGTGCPSGRAGGTKYPSVNVFRNRTIWSSSASVKPRLPTFRLRF